MSSVPWRRSDLSDLAGFSGIGALSMTFYI
jgi:hypothetical protein